jgi:hypothetical protein
MLGLIRAAAYSLIIGRRAICVLRLMIVKQGFAYIKVLWCSQTIIKPDDKTLGVNARVDGVDIGQHLVGPIALDQMHRCLAGEARQRF